MESFGFIVKTQNDLAAVDDAFVAWRDNKPFSSVAQSVLVDTEDFCGIVVDSPKVVNQTILSLTTCDIIDSDNETLNEFQLSISLLGEKEEIPASLNDDFQDLLNNYYEFDGVHHSSANDSIVFGAWYGSDVDKVILIRLSTYMWSFTISNGVYANNYIEHIGDSAADSFGFILNVNNDTQLVDYAISKWENHETFNDNANVIAIDDEYYCYI
ncbi:hypothetical protein NCAS_0B00360 [Naumovozyma castellii]|uniref:Uncharacterized protein n=1 Tax=Naumovozyma castellii TaxID=27288 RepID=G0VAZ7_NAUCA|nr:hypothetical protein NCAS_0B00360 [Naumovozyma castellii CBS 4309]CCC68120.1 hypothetical protein NCAS_0B00360 [Naumovozyma castellii CBS 4309]